MILFFISLIIIMASLAASVLVDSTSVRCIMAMVCMAGVWLMCLGWRRMYMAMLNLNKAHLDQLEGENKQQIEAIKSFLVERQTESATPPPMRDDATLKERITALNAYLTSSTTGKLNDDYRRLIADLENAAELEATMDAIDKNSVQPLMDQINNIKLQPVPDSADIDDIENQLLRLAFATVDLSQGFRTDYNQYGSIASRLAAGLITEEEATTSARLANDSILETPQNIRVLRAVASKHPNTTFFVKDFKLNN